MNKTTATNGMTAAELIPKAEDFRPVGRDLMVASYNIPAFDAAAVFQSAAGRRFLWQQPEANQALVGAGSAWFRAAGAQSPIESLRAAWRESIGGGSSQVPEEGRAPLAFLAQPFETSSRLAAQDGGAGGFLLVPRLLLSRNQDNFQLTLTVDRGERDFARISEEIASLLAGLPGSESGSAKAAVTSAEEASAERWRGQVGAILERIGEGALEKAVLARRIILKSDQLFALRAALETLEQRYAHCTVFAFSLGESCFLGATPERLLRLEQGRVSVDCVAGSIALGETPEEAEALAATILSDAKELNEHAIVGQFVREALEPLVEQVEAPNEPTIRRTADLQHLSTPFSGSLREDRDVFDLLRNLHPTPATGGFPRDEALSLLRSVEGFDRCWYAGPCGWIDAAGNGELSVAIRSALIEGDKATLYAGSGIVSGSDADREFEETALKLRTMQWALQAR